MGSTHDDQANGHAERARRTRHRTSPCCCPRRHRRRPLTLQTPPLPALLLPHRGRRSDDVSRLDEEAAARRNRRANDHTPLDTPTPTTPPTHRPSTKELSPPSRSCPLAPRRLLAAITPSIGPIAPIASSRRMHRPLRPPLLHQRRRVHKIAAYKDKDLSQAPNRPCWRRRSVAAGVGGAASGAAWRRGGGGGGGGGRGDLLRPPPKPQGSEDELAVTTVTMEREGMAQMAPPLLPPAAPAPPHRDDVPAHGSPRAAALARYAPSRYACSPPDAAIDGVPFRPPPPISPAAGDWPTTHPHPPPCRRRRELTVKHDARPCPPRPRLTRGALLKALAKRRRPLRVPTKRRLQSAVCRPDVGQDDGLGDALTESRARRWAR